MKNIFSYFKSNSGLYCFLLIMLLGSFLRVYDTGKRDLWYDELYSIKLAKEGVPANIENTENNQPPLYQIILHFWMKFFGSDKIAVRSLSILFGMVSIWLIYEVSYLLFEQKAALLSSFLVAVSNFHIYYSQETRDYAMFTALTLASFLFLIKSLETAKTRFFIYYFIVTSFLYYAHNYALFIILAQNLFFLIRWEKYKRLKFKWFFAQAGAFVLFMPWLPSLFKQIEVKHLIISPPSLNNLFETLEIYIDFGKRDLILLFIVVIFFIILLLIKKGGDSSALGGADKVALLSLWLFCPIVIALVISKLLFPIYIVRYTICASAAFYIILARLMSKLR